MDFDEFKKIVPYKIYIIITAYNISRLKFILRKSLMHFVFLLDLFLSDCLQQTLQLWQWAGKVPLLLRMKYMTYYTIIFK